LLFKDLCRTVKKIDKIFIYKTDHDIKNIKCLKAK